MGWMIGDSSPGTGWEFSLHHCVQTGSWAHLSSYPVGTRGPFPAGKAARMLKLTTHLHLVPKSRMHGAIPPLPQYAFTAWCSVKKSKGAASPSPYLKMPINANFDTLPLRIRIIVDIKHDKTDHIYIQETCLLALVISNAVSSGYLWANECSSRSISCTWLCTLLIHI
jgi:hypothetical protein